MAVTRVAETDAGITYTGTWKTATNARAFDGTMKYVDNGDAGTATSAFPGKPDLQAGSRRATKSPSRRPAWTSRITSISWTRGTPKTTARSISRWSIAR